MAPKKNSASNLQSAAAPTHPTVVKIASMPTAEAEAGPEKEEETCSICLDTLSSGKNTALPCSHLFHNKCLKALRKSKLKQACPLCRSPLPRTAKQIRRAQEISYHLALLEHASSCTNVLCPSNNCQIMKQELIHLDECLDRGNCINSTRMNTLIHIHSHACDKPICEVPHCNSIRERMVHRAHPELGRSEAVAGR